MERDRRMGRDIEDISVFTLLVVIGAFVLMILLSGLTIRDTIVAIQRQFNKRTKNT